MLNTIRWASEIRPRDALDLPPAGKGKLKEGELKMARQLIGDMTSPWKPGDYEDKFTAAIHALAAQRVKAGDTEKVTPIETDEVPSAASNVVDLTELLRQSLGHAEAPGEAKKAAAARRAATARQGRAGKGRQAKRASAKRAPRKSAGRRAVRHRHGREEVGAAARRLSRRRPAGRSH